MDKEFIQKLIIAFVQNGTLTLPKSTSGEARMQKRIKLKKIFSKPLLV